MGNIAVEIIEDDLERFAVVVVCVVWRSVGVSEWMSLGFRNEKVVRVSFKKASGLNFVRVSEVLLIKEWERFAFDFIRETISRLHTTITQCKIKRKCYFDVENYTRIYSVEFAFPPKGSVTQHWNAKIAPSNDNLTTGYFVITAYWSGWRFHLMKVSGYFVLGEDFT